ncbi:hypothetical protein M0R45_035517 [Rubus argutus]|uniref:Uncharacterized protein n=1 Tax=Rubus argutus TaxID=59490 RepID=A0AAW1VX53_RUBAR
MLDDQMTLNIGFSNLLSEIVDGQKIHLIQGEERNVAVGIPKPQSRRDCDNPNPNFIADLYTRVLTTFDFFAREDGKVDFDALEMLENLDFHESSVQGVKLYHVYRETRIDLVPKVVDQLTDLEKQHIQINRKYIK